MSPRKLGIALAAALVTAPAAAQLPSLSAVSLEVRGGLALPAADLKRGGLAESGFAWTGSVSYAATPAIAGFVGYSRSSFGVEEEASATYTDEGFAGGVRAQIPTSVPAINPWLRAAVVRHVFSIDGVGPDADGETRPTWGYEVGGGLSVGITGRIQLTPGIIYTSTSPNSVDISHTRFDVGLRVGL